jgi:N-acetylmuramoyl-L-alanine amidase
MRRSMAERVEWILRNLIIAWMLAGDVLMRQASAREGEIVRELGIIEVFAFMFIMGTEASFEPAREGLPPPGVIRRASACLRAALPSFSEFDRLIGRLFLCRHQGSDPVLFPHSGTYLDLRGDRMAVINTTNEEIKLLARLMRAEAEGDGTLGMLLVGNVGVNRVLGDCLDFRGIRRLQQMVFQSPGGFEAVQKPYFYQPARQMDVRLAQRVVRGERYDPGRYALWFFEPPGNCPPTWFNQFNSGRYKSHCFYMPARASCRKVYMY